MKSPAPSHIHPLKDLLSYLNGRTSATVQYQRPTMTPSNQFTCYADADHASSVDDSRSTSGYVVIMNCGPISWSVSKQKSPSSSLTKSEYKSRHHATLEVIWLRQLIMEMGYEQLAATIIHEDNEAAIECTKTQ